MHHRGSFVLTASWSACVCVCIEQNILNAKTRTCSYSIKENYILILPCVCVFYVLAFANPPTEAHLLLNFTFLSLYFHLLFKNPSLWQLCEALWFVSIDEKHYISSVYYNYCVCVHSCVCVRVRSTGTGDGIPLWFQDPWLTLINTTQR